MEQGWVTKDPFAPLYYKKYMLNSSNRDHIDVCLDIIKNLEEELSGKNWLRNTHPLTHGSNHSRDRVVFL